ncbi:hypothetical protein ACWGOE_07255 [Leucobacter chromiiresistens]
MDIPENAKTPQDRKKKKKPAGKRASVEFRGVTYTARDEDALDDIDVVEALDNQALTVALRLILGETEYERLKENLADPDTGKTKGSDIAKFWKQFIAENQVAKN